MSLIGDQPNKKTSLTASVLWLNGPTHRRSNRDYFCTKTWIGCRIVTRSSVRILDKITDCVANNTGSNPCRGHCKRSKFYYLHVLFVGWVVVERHLAMASQQKSSFQFLNFWKIHIFAQKSFITLPPVLESISIFRQWSAAGGWTPKSSSNSLLLDNELSGGTNDQWQQNDFGRL